VLQSLDRTSGSKIADELGFTLAQTAKWADIHVIRDNGGGKYEKRQRFEPASPFRNRKVIE
jgi:hypothetical protein